MGNWYDETVTAENNNYNRLIKIKIYILIVGHFYQISEECLEQLICYTTIWLAGNEFLYQYSFCIIYMMMTALNIKKKIAF